MLKNLIATARELGSGNALLYWIDQLGVRSCSSRLRIFKYYFVVQAIGDKPFLPGHRGASISVQKFSSPEPPVRSLPIPPAVVDDRFKQDSCVLVAKVNNQYAGHIWYTLASYREDEVRCTYELEPRYESAWDFDSSIADQFRLSLVFAKLWDEARRSMFEAGVRASASRISAFNVGSLRAHQRLGARKRGFAVFLVIGSVQLTVASLPPFVHFSLGAGSAPSVRIKTRD